MQSNPTIFAAEATAISLALSYYRHMGPVHHDVVIYSDSMSCLQTIEGEDIDNPFICHAMNLLWLLGDIGTHCGIDGNGRVDQLVKETLDQDIDPLASVHYRFEATGQLLHSADGSNQVGCSCAWPWSLPRETNTGTTKEIPALKQSWRGCDHLTSNWPYQGHRVPYLVPRTTDRLSTPLWSNIEDWPYASRVCNITGMSWRKFETHLLV